MVPVLCCKCSPNWKTSSVACSRQPWVAPISRSNQLCESESRHHHFPPSPYVSSSSAAWRLCLQFFQALARWQKRFPGRVVTLDDIGELFGIAYLRAATSSNAIEGFNKTGIAKCDINVFQARDFLPASVTGDNDSPPTPVENDERIQPPIQPPTTTVLDPALQPPEEEEINQIENEQSSPLAFPLPERNGGQTKGFKSPHEIRPVPQNVKNTIKKRLTRKQKSEVLTSSPFKNQLEEKKKSKLAKLQLNEKKKSKPQNEKRKMTKKDVPKRKPVKRRLSMPGEEQEAGGSGLIFPKPPKEPQHEEDSELRLICNSATSRPKETWLQCNMCSLWAHEACTSYDGIGFYICDFCVC